MLFPGKKGGFAESALGESPSILGHGIGGSEQAFILDSEVGRVAATEFRPAFQGRHPIYD